MNTFVLMPENNRYQVILNMNAWVKGIYFAEVRSSLETRVVKILKN